MEKKVILFFVIMIISAFLIYKTMVTLKAERERKIYGRLCSLITDELNKEINENSTCRNYYCYYLPYKPPKGLERTKTLCICDCKLANGTIIKVQVLIPT